VRIAQDQAPFTLDDLFVALPSRKALRKLVLIRYAGRVCPAVVLDVGPWFPYRAAQFPDQGDDDAYVFHGEPPRAEQWKGHKRRGDPRQLPINGAGIDLGDGVIQVLGGAPLDWGLRRVAWRFAEEVEDEGLENNRDGPAGRAAPVAEDRRP